MTITDIDLVSLALLRLQKSWENFQDAVSGKENISSWERQWSDCVQEEIRRGTRVGRSTLIEDEENFALTSKSRKAKGKKGQGEVESSQKGKKKKKDQSKIKCFHCHEFRHYTTKHPNQKEDSSKDHVTTSAEVDVFFFSVRKYLINSLHGKLSRQ